MPQVNDTVLTVQVAEKIKNLVDDRKYLGFSQIHSAATSIEKLIRNATDDDAQGESLCEAEVLLSRACGGDKARKIRIVTAALEVLRTQQRVAKAKAAVSRRVPVSDDQDWLSSVQADAMASSGAR